MVQVAELRGAIGHAEGVLNEPTDQDALEVQSHLGHVGLAPHPDLDLLLQRLRLVPGVPAERVGAMLWASVNRARRPYLGLGRNVPCGVPAGVCFM
ncbi:Uncharacterised protein [Mycobacteroides abscessus subsp. massiliense]|nr:Uncharacterised protein [Mycobacteroides abscessus subsp. massiliense]